MTLRRILLTCLVALAGLVVVAGSIQAAQVDTPPEQQAEVTTEPDNGVQPTPGFSNPVQTASSSISALGSIEANQVASLQFQTAGTIEGLYVQVGDYIQAGEVLADLDADDAWNSYQQALLNLESANLAMDELMQPPSEDDLAVAQANVYSAQASYSSTANSVTPEQLASAQLKYDQAVATLQALQDARANMSGTEAEITIQEAQIGAASFNAEIARLQLEEMQTPNSSSLWSASIRIQQAQLQLEQLQEPPTQAEIDSLQVSIDRAQASVDSAQLTLQQTQLVAPITGYVTTLNVVSGDAVTGSTVVLELSDTSTLRMTVPINELDIGQINEGENAVVHLDALADLDIPGTVENVGWLAATSSDGIVTYDVQVVLDTDDPRVRIGMTGEVTIEMGNTAS